MSEKIVFLNDDMSTGDYRLSDHFMWSEHVCKGCDGKCGRQQPVHVDLYPKLDIIREYINQPLHINSGFRCLEHNAKVKGAKKSQHLLGVAADVCPQKKTKEAFDAIIEKAVELSFTGIKRYSTFIHLDVRDGAKWHDF